MTTDAEASIIRALMWEVNVSYLDFTADMLDSLVEYVSTDLGPGVLTHPAFPHGVIRAWAAHNGIDLRPHEKHRHDPEGD